MHEAQLHEHSCFVTLTYDEAHLPAGLSLDHRHFQLFMKRFREHALPAKIRFYMCGEYGDINGRPHYHALVFGHFPVDRVFFRTSGAGSKCYTSKSLDALWGYGSVFVGDVLGVGGGVDGGVVVVAFAFFSFSVVLSTKVCMYSFIDLFVTLSSRVISSFSSFNRPSRSASLSSNCDLVIFLLLTIVFNLFITFVCNSFSFVSFFCCLSAVSAVSAASVGAMLS